MWLLSTARAELTFFPTVEAARNQVYAILSHVWDPTEQSFQDTQRHRLECEATGENPRDRSTSKVKESCMLAERHGYKWIWNDTCCIDKTSSAELSEAINSMYTYYALAEVCFAYLRDVPTDSVLEDIDSAFRESRWFTRGWTLQELIAPDHVVFVSSHWEILGTKADLASLLADITWIPVAVLLLEEEVRDISIARRMSWASNRVTTRPEDEAYCLMGIFEVNMPTLYGEGRQAFRRLQEEIMKGTIDTTLFAWGHVLDVCPATIDPWDRLDDHEMYLFAPSPSHFAEARATDFDPHTLEDLQPTEDQFWTPKSSPLDFVESPTTAMMALPYGGQAHVSTRHAVQQLPDRDLSLSLINNMIRPGQDTEVSSEAAGVPTFNVTSYGVHAHIPVVEVNGISIAILFSSRDNQPLGLLLGPCDRAVDPTRPLYHPCIYSGQLRWRLINLNIVRSTTGTLSGFTWRSIYLTHIPLTRPTTHLLMNRGRATPFRIPQRLIDNLQKAKFKLSLPASMRFPWHGQPAATLTMFNPHWFGLHDILVHFGRCSIAGGPARMSSDPGVDVRSRAGGHVVPDALGPHWAMVSVAEQASRRDPDASTDVDHDCATDHIMHWPDYQRSFTPIDSSRWAVAIEITLSFVPDSLNPASTYIMDISFKRWHRSTGRVLFQTRRDG
ncbi:heterokaryon incompatibility protein-domain-containing protein [Fomes fomentarius]|nr:heterokaryon incompatibility protein-domain-containing protein [Fomes fomentarius]